MKKIICLMLVVLFTVSAFAGCSDGREDFKAGQYEVDGSEIQGIFIDVRDRKIEVATSDDGRVHLEYSESEKEFYNISVSDEQILTVTAGSDKDWTDYFGSKSPADVRKIILRVPDGLLKSLHISTTNEDLSLSTLTVTEEISLSVNGGSISFDRLDAGKSISLNTKNGDLRGGFADSYENFSIACNIKKGNSNLPSRKEEGAKSLSVTVNNGDAELDFSIT